MFTEHQKNRGKRVIVLLGGALCRSNLTSPLWATCQTAMNIEQVREQLHLLIDEVDDLYVLNGLYRNLSSDKRQRNQYEKEQAKKVGKKTS